MQEAELTECVEQVFASALARTYQLDALIDLYHTLRCTWQNLVQPSDQRIYRIKLVSALRQIKCACLRSQENSQLAEADFEVVRQIESQFVQLEVQAKFP